MEARLTTAPRPRLSIPGNTILDMAGTEATLTLTWLQMSFSEASSNSMGCDSMTPTLFTAREKNLSMERDMRTRFMPLLASSLAYSFPMPSVLPVTTVGGGKLSAKTLQ
ncbi:hypothetical protein E2C01_036190 [Portunus trituberculatus]|uniref:Uncharacterized protein n=1 Tax=Portunus trituberculatus TaxID=210409 RepID=A0A5B7FBT7_PORTR|nr:hypothetical protein [Portunus trituberculatus]